MGGETVGNSPVAADHLLLDVLGLWSGYLLAGSAQFLVQAMIYFGLPIFFAVVLIQRWQLVSGDQLSAHRQVFQQ